MTDYEDEKTDVAYQEMKDANAENGLPPRHIDGHSIVYSQEWTK